MQLKIELSEERKNARRLFSRLSKLAVLLLSAGITTQLAVAAPPAGSHVTFNDEGIALVDGKPFFPIGVFTYNRAAQSAPGAGVALDYLLVAPASPVTIDSISLSSFDQDALDDLKINVVPEPAGVAMWIGLAAGAWGLGARKRRRGGHAPQT